MLKFRYFAFSLVLAACTTVPALHNPNPDLAGPAPALNADSSALDSDVRLTSSAEIESAQLQVSQVGSQDRLQLSVMIKGANYQTQRLELNAIKHLKAWVKGPGISGQINNLGSFVSVLNQNQATTLDITLVPRGKYRVVTVQGYQQEANGVTPELAGATLKAVYDSPANSTEIVLTFNWRSTAEAEIIEALLALSVQQPEVTTLLENLDKSALGALLDKLIYGNHPVGGINYAVHPDRLSATGLAQAIVTAAGTLPAYAISDPVPAAWQKTTHDASLTIRTPSNAAFLNSDIQIQITDPASAPIIISNGSDTALIPKIVPGQWDAVVSIAGLNGGVSTRATVTVNPDGTATLSAGEPGNPIILPPVLKSINTSAANTGQMTINGDGFDTFALANNLVKFGDTPAEIVSMSGIAIIVKIPPGISGNTPVTVTVGGKTSNQGNVAVPARVVTLDSFKGVVNDEVTITVAGYDPSQIASIVRFQGSTTDAEILASTNNTIRVRVPADATTSGPITITPTGLSAITSPTYTIGNTPSIQSLSTNGPYTFGQQFTITGTNLADASANMTIGGAAATIFFKTTNAAGQDVLSVTVGSFTGAPVNSEVVVTTPNGTARYTPISTPSPAAMPPTITQVTPPDPNQASPTTQLVGQHYSAVSRVSIGGVLLPTTDYTIVDDQHITVNRLPGGVVLGPIKVTNPDGSASASLTYKDVVNYIGPTASAPNTQIPESAFSTLHGINVDRNNHIYTVDLGGTIIKFAYNPVTKTHARKWTLTTANATGSKEDIANDLNGNLYVANTGGNAIQKITVSTDGLGNETPQISTLVKVNSPEGIETDANGNLYVTSTGGSQTCIYKLSNLDKPSANTSTLQTCNGIKAAPITGADNLNVSVLAGGSQRFGSPPITEPIATAQFGHLEGLGIDGQGHLYIAEVENRLIRRLNPQSGQVTIFANMGLGTSTNAPRMTMHEIRVDRLGNVFVPSSSDGSPAKGIYHISPEGKISLIAGSEVGLTGLEDGDPLQAARFRDPRGIDFGPDGTLYVASGAWGVRKIERYHPVTNLQVP